MSSDRWKPSASPRCCRNRRALSSLRVASAVSVLVYSGLAAIVVTDRLGSTARRQLLTGASLLMVLGTVANLATQSPVERLWAPVAATLAVTLWRIRGSR